MSKSISFPNELIIDGKLIMSDKDSDGKIRSVELMMDPDYNKQALGAESDTVSCYLLKSYDRWNSYHWNCCAGSYFCEEGVL